MYAVLFDIDGTLVNTGGAGKHAFAATFADDFGVTQIDAKVAFAGRSDRAITLELMTLHNVAPSEENWTRFLAGYIGRLKGALAHCEGQVLPGVVELLDQLREMDSVAVGLLTGNVHAGAREKLSYYGLADRFAFGGYGDDHDNRNDIAAAAVRSASEYMANGRLFGTMVIGDTVNDVTCAQSVDSYAVAVATGGSSFEELRATGPDLLVNDLTDCETLLAEIRGAVERGQGTVA
jgi:phosphoglycolate phosphatase